jgi:hypothetical protein
MVVPARVIGSRFLHNAAADMDPVSLAPGQDGAGQPDLPRFNQPDDEAV